MKKEAIAYRRPNDPVSEKFKTLGINIQFMNANKFLKTMLITSTVPGEGKSWVSANLAITYANEGQKVILVDADMRKGRQFSIFGLDQRPGLSNYLSGVGIDKSIEKQDDIKEYIKNTEVENLSVLTAGNVPPNPLELLKSAKMKRLISTLKKDYDIVIIDGTPASMVMDSYIVCRMVDTTLIVVARNKIRKHELKIVVDNIRKIKGSISGIVFNKTKTNGIQDYNSRSYYYEETFSINDFENEDMPKNQEKQVIAKSRSTNATKRAEERKPKRMKDEPLEKVDIQRKVRQKEQVKNQKRKVKETNKTKDTSKIENKNIKNINKPIRDVKKRNKIIKQEKMALKDDKELEAENKKRQEIEAKERTKELLKRINKYVEKNG